MPYSWAFCEQCGQQFQRLRRDAQYCSNRCRNEHFRVVQKAKKDKLKGFPRQERQVLDALQQVSPRVVELIVLARRQGLVAGRAALWVAIQLEYPEEQLPSDIAAALEKIGMFSGTVARDPLAVP